jgi:hypothetical protein
MSFDGLVLLLPVRRIAAFWRRIAVFDRHPLVGVDGFQVGGLSCGALLLDSVGERDIVGKGTTVAHLSQPTPTLMTAHTSVGARYAPPAVPTYGSAALPRGVAVRSEFSDSTHILVLMHCSREFLVNKGVDDPDPVDDNLHIAE